jgi:uncharacterized membrane protein
MMPRLVGIMDTKESPRLAQQMRLQTIGYILTALGLVVGLAWNDAVSTLIDSVIPMGKESIWAKFIYAGVITFLVIIISGYIQRRIQSEKE